MSEQMSALAIALALTAKHIEPVKPLVVADPLPIRSKQEAKILSPHSKKTIHNRKRNKLAAKSRKRNRK